MKNLKKSETEACIVAITWVICYGVGCYMQSMAVILISTLFVATLLACSWRIEQLEKRIAYYRRELDRQIREECETEFDEQEQPQIIMSKGKTA